MLHYSTIYPKTLQLLKSLQKIKYLNDYLLVGGTALALQMGHRISMDLDLFAFSKNDASEILVYINDLGSIKILNQSPRVLNILINDIKVDFVSYFYDFIDSPVTIDNLKLASTKDIAAMKLSAITSRGSKKDFVDIYFLLDLFTLPELFEFYKLKYSDGSSFLVFKSLTYFADADLEPMPKMVKQVNWSHIKEKINLEVKNYFP